MWGHWCRHPSAHGQSRAPSLNVDVQWSSGAVNGEWAFVVWLLFVPRV